MRRQTGLAHKVRQVGVNPQRSYDSILVGRIIDTHPEHNTVDIATVEGYIVRGATMLGDSGGTSAGQNGLPQITNLPQANVEPQTTGDQRKLYDEGGPTHGHDTYAVVGFTNGYQNKPFVLGLTAPNSHQNSFSEPNLKMQRDIHDILDVTWTDDKNDLRPPPFGQGPVDPKHPLEILHGNWQKSFPDRYDDPDPSSGDSGDDYQSYMLWGYRDVPRTFGNGTQQSTNFDKDKHPFQLSQAQKGDEKQAQRDYARGFTLNQRWRSRFQIDNDGNVLLRAEGRDFDSTHFNDVDVAQGSMTLWSRLDMSTWSRSWSQWVRMRPRYDGNPPNGLAPDESLEEAKRVGSYGLRIQRDYDVSVRRQATVTFVEGYTFNVGDYDTRWNGGPGGVDPGTQWDNTVLNPDFRDSVDNDKIWRGTKKDGYLRGANVSYAFTRPNDSLQDGPQFFSWVLNNKQTPIDGETTSDCNWSLLQQTVQGNTSWTAIQQPGQGSATASWQLAGSEGDAVYTISVTSDAAHDSIITLEAVGMYNSSIIIDSQAGTVNIVAPNGLFVNGVQVLVP